MLCPDCGSSTRVLESRSTADGAAVRRRRRCANCGRRLTTYERRDLDRLFVTKRSGERERFDRVKLRAGLLRAAHKRPVDPAAIDRLVDRIESAVERAGGDLPAQRIGEFCLAGLEQLDGLSYLQFASVYKQLADVDDVQAELARLAAFPPPSSVRRAGEDAVLPPEIASRRGSDG